MNFRIVRAALSVVFILWFAAPQVAAQSKPPPKPIPKPKRPGAILVKLVLSTGDNIEGESIPGNSRLITLRVKNRRVGILAANVIRLSLKFAEHDEVAPGDLTGTERRLAVGKYLLKRRHIPLAGLVFRHALVSDPTVADKISAIYKNARVVVPKDLGGRKGVKLAKRRYVLPTIAQVRACNEKAAQWGRRMKEIAPKTHLVESRFFLIYSAWSKKDDRALVGIYDKLYATLCKQFDIPAGENIWIGKLPVYAFWEKGDYVRFLTMVCRVSASTAANSGGIAGRRTAGKGASRSPFSYVALGPVKMKGMSRLRAKNWFFELLTHESTHAFLSRYMGPVHVISWVNEGIAETIASTLVSRSGAAEKLKRAHAAVRSRSADFADMLTMDNIPLENLYYGAAQSLVRFLIKADRRKFIRFVELLKEGKSSADALKGAYDGLTHEKLIAAWKRYAGR